MFSSGPEPRFPPKFGSGTGAVRYWTHVGNFSQPMSGERVGFRFKHADAVVKRNPQGRSRRGWVMEPVEQTTSRGTKMPAYRIRWRDSERPEIVLQHMLIADPDPTPPPEGVSLVPPAPKG